MRIVSRLPDFIRKPWRRLQERRRAASPFWTTYGAAAELSVVDGGIVINDQRKFIYIRVPKAANSTVMASLYASETGRVIERGGIRNNTGRFYRHPSQLNAAEVERLADYTAFIVVRHPVKRLLSAYRDKIVAKKPPSRHVFKALGRDPAQSTISLEDFVSYLEGGGLMADLHWMPQRHFMPQGFRPLDEIGKVESLAEDLARIFGRIYQGDYKLTDYRPHATGASKVEIDAALSARIAALYADDFAAFGYAR